MSKKKIASTQPKAGELPFRISLPLWKASDLFLNRRYFAWYALKYPEDYPEMTEEQRQQLHILACSSEPSYAKKVTYYILNENNVPVSIGTDREEMLQVATRQKWREWHHWHQSRLWTTIGHYTILTQFYGVALNDWICMWETMVLADDTVIERKRMDTWEEAQKFHEGYVEMRKE